MSSRRQFHTYALAFGATSCVPVWAQTSTFPSKPVKIIVPYAAGGGPDVQTRKLALKFAEFLGQNVVVDNIVGAGGILAAQSVRARHRTATRSSRVRPRTSPRRRCCPA